MVKTRSQKDDEDRLRQRRDNSSRTLEDDIARTKDINAPINFQFKTMVCY